VLKRTVDNHKTSVHKTCHVAVLMML